MEGVAHHVRSLSGTPLRGSRQCVVSEQTKMSRIWIWSNDEEVDDGAGLSGTRAQDPMGRALTALLRRQKVSDVVGPITPLIRAPNRRS